jgi:hypothetical protein
VAPAEDVRPRNVPAHLGKNPRVQRRSGDERRRKLPYALSPSPAVTTPARFAIPTGPASVEGVERMTVREDVDHCHPTVVSQWEQNRKDKPKVDTAEQ